MKSSRNGQSMTVWSGTKVVSIKPVAGSDITKVIFADFRWATAKDE
jgi:hypothetical protein